MHKDTSHKNLDASPIIKVQILGLSLHLYKK